MKAILKNIKRNSKGRIIHADISMDVVRVTAQTDALLHEAQKVVDSETVRHLQAFVPLKTGILSASFARGTEIGSGEVQDNVPYGHYQNFLDMPYKTIEPGDARYSSDPNRGSHFVERVIEQKGDEIVSVAQRAINRKG